MGWPQYVYLALTFMGMGVCLVKDGERRDGKYSFWSSLLSSAFILWVLYVGGFFGGGA